MSVRASLIERQTKLAAWVMLFLWLIYTLIYTLPFEKNLEAILEGVVGASGVVVLLLMGFPRQELYLQVRPVSRKGWIALGLATLALLGPLAASRWEGFHGLPLLVYAPLSGVTQELFSVPACCRLSRDCVLVKPGVQ